MNNRPLHLKVIWNHSLIPLQRALSLVMFDIMYTILSWLVVCRTTWCLMKSESIERYTPLPMLCLLSFSADHTFVRGRHFLIFCFVSWSEGLYWHVCSFNMCYLLMNIYKFLIKDANWHALPIDEYLQNFQLKMLIGMCYLLMNIYKIFN